MNIVYGNALEYCGRGHFDVLILSCNCQKIPDSLLAASVYERYPHVRAFEMENDTDMLGTMLTTRADNFHIISAYVRAAHGAPPMLEAVRTILQEVRQRFTGKLIACTPIAGMGNEVYAYELAGERASLIVPLATIEEEVDRTSKRQRTHYV